MQYQKSGWINLLNINAIKTAQNLFKILRITKCIKRNVTKQSNLKVDPFLTGRSYITKLLQKVTVTNTSRMQITQKIATSTAKWKFEKLLTANVMAISLLLSIYDQVLVLYPAIGNLFGLQVSAFAALEQNYTFQQLSFFIA